jgi:hypothetical protein
MIRRHSLKVAAAGVIAMLGTAAGCGSPSTSRSAKLEGVLELMVAENPHMGGWFADDLGTRSYFSGLDWDALPTETRQEYRDRAIALAQIFRRVADRHGLMFLVNGSWMGGPLETSGGGYPEMMQDGCALADGGVLELHVPDAFHVNYSSSPQWASWSATTQGTSFQYVIAPSDDIRDAWIESGSCAFVSTQTEYGQVPVPYSPLHPTGLPSGVAW